MTQPALPMLPPVLECEACHATGALPYPCDYCDGTGEVYLCDACKHLLHSCAACADEIKGLGALVRPTKRIAYIL